MAGEHILVADETRFVQEVCQAVLEEHGYRVSSASNGLALVNFPEAAGVDLFIVDSSMEGWDGSTTTKTIRQTVDIATVPILLLVDEDEMSERESVTLRGANAHLLKPFTPKELLGKVMELLEERRVVDAAREKLAEVADEKIRELADEQVQAAVEKKTQIIVERMIQRVIEAIDDKGRREIDAKVTALSAEKEQELIRTTVTEVARSMIDKQAEEKVTSAIEAELSDRVDKAVRRAADSIIPSIARERIKDSLQNILQREVQVRVQQAAEGLVPDVSQRLIATIDTLTQKIVPKIARESIPQIAERQIQVLSSKTIPTQIDNQVRSQVANQMRDQIHPQLVRATRKLWFRIAVMNVAALFGILALVYWVLTQAGIPMPWD